MAEAIEHLGRATARWGAMNPLLRSSARSVIVGERLADPEAVLSRSDLRALGYERRAIDAIYRSVPVQVWPGYSRPLITVRDFVEWRERCTYRGDRVRP